MKRYSVVLKNLCRLHRCPRHLRRGDPPAGVHLHRGNPGAEQVGSEAASLLRDQPVPELSGLTKRSGVGPGPDRSDMGELGEGDVADQDFHNPVIRRVSLISRRIA